MHLNIKSHTYYLLFIEYRMTTYLPILTSYVRVIGFNLMLLFIMRTYLITHRGSEPESFGIVMLNTTRNYVQLVNVVVSMYTVLSLKTNNLKYLTTDGKRPGPYLLFNY